MATNLLPKVALERRAQIPYTSGTTGKPKGAVTTHANLLAQVEVLLEEWGWNSTDFALNVLSLHHTHGIINVLCCALAAGASRASREDQKCYSEAARKLRLMVSGSTALLERYGMTEIGMAPSNTRS